MPSSAFLALSLRRLSSSSLRTDALARELSVIRSRLFVRALRRLHVVPTIVGQAFLLAAPVESKSAGRNACPTNFTVSATAFLL
jgi:hypothetical protein